MHSCAGVLCAIILVVLLASAQAGEQAITVNVDLVNIYFTVCNKKGRIIPNLERERFTVSEDGNRQTVTNFSRETDVPLTITLLIDTSGSVRYKLGFEQDAAIHFLNSTLRPAGDKAAVFSFDSSVNLLEDYTYDSELLANAVRRTRSGGGTRLYDALYVLLTGTVAAQEGRRGIVLLTDGDDKSSRITPRQVVEAAQRSNAAIYAVSVNSFGMPLNDSDRIDGVLEMLAAETGGQAFFPKGVKELSSSFKVITNELRSQYTIAYRSTNPKRDGAFRKIRIEVKDAHHSVRSRTGYDAPISATAEQR